ncbi:MAG: DoxX family protein [Planctomycetes bacterium]|nr:DoxX family protein [Planctomycetota bacterium]
MVRISFLTCVFLIGLRLVIGWHFFFEGANKVRSVYTGETEKTVYPGGMEKSVPFTSAGYLNKAEGPLGNVTREQLGDPDSNAVKKLTLAKSADDKPTDRMPAALDEEWKAYLKQFTEDYKLDEQGKELANIKLDQAKNKYVLWLTDETPKLKEGREKKKDEEPKKIKKTIKSVNSTIEYEIDDKVVQRVLDYKSKLAEIRDVLERRNPDFAKDVAKAHLQTLGNDAAAMRTELMNDVDKHTKDFKESLAKIVGDRLVGYSIGPPEDLLVDDRVLELLAVREGTTNSDDALIQRMPSALAKQWDDYYAYEKEIGKEALRNDPKRGDEIVTEAKLRYVRFLLDLDQFSGQPRPDKDVTERLTAYRAAVAKLRKAQDTFMREPVPINFIMISEVSPEPIRLRKTFIDDISNQTEYLKKVLGGFKDEGYKGVTQVEKESTRILWRDFPATRMGWLDWSTRWVLLVAGGCLLIGLFTRLACFACIVFLVMEYLLNPAFPWLPVSPKAEGNYMFINKNMVELFALFVLITLPTGRWLGLDAILSRIWPFRRRES